MAKQAKCVNGMYVGWEFTAFRNAGCPRTWTGLYPYGQQVAFWQMHDMAMM